MLEDRFVLSPPVFAIYVVKEKPGWRRAECERAMGPNASINVGRPQVCPESTPTEPGRGGHAGSPSGDLPKFGRLEGRLEARVPQRLDKKSRRAGNSSPGSRRRSPPHSNGRPTSAKPLQADFARVSMATWHIVPKVCSRSVCRAARQPHCKHRALARLACNCLRRFLFFSASCPAVPMTSSIAGTNSRARD